MADAGRPITQANAARRVVADWGALIERFEEGRSNDMRMPAMGSQVAVCLRQMERAIRQGPQREIGVR